MEANESNSGANRDESPSENNQNVLDQQFHLLRESEESVNDDWGKGALDTKFLSMLDNKVGKQAEKPNGQKKGSEFRTMSFGKSQTSKKELNNTDSFQKANEDTLNYLRQIHDSQILDHQETILKSRADHCQAQEAQLDRHDAPNTKLTKKKATLCERQNKPSDVNERIIKNAHRGSCGIGFTDTNEYGTSRIRPESNGRPDYGEPLSEEEQEEGEIQETKNIVRRNGANFRGARGQMNMFEMKNSFRGTQLLRKRPFSKNPSDSIHYCEKHTFKKVEFICSFSGCLRELCSMCILDHKEHINAIKHINTHIEEQFETVRHLNLKAIKKDINKAEVIHSDRLDSLNQEICQLVNKKFNSLRNDLILANNRARKRLNDIKRFKEEYQVLQSNPRLIEFNNFGSKSNTELVKSCISYNEMDNECGVSIERNTFLSQLRRILDDNLLVNSPVTDFNTVELDMPKYLHWFEWGERNLHLFDIVEHKSRSIKLINNIKIPNFSRSIVTPQAKIFLLGGEDSEGQPKKEIYMFDLMKLDREHILEPKALMPHQKYDFTLCHLNGYIYVICGKDTTSEAVNICEK